MWPRQASVSSVLSNSFGLRGGADRTPAFVMARRTGLYPPRKTGYQEKHMRALQLVEERKLEIVDLPERTPLFRVSAEVILFPFGRSV